jgi:hypothetical protein
MSLLIPIELPGSVSAQRSAGQGGQQAVFDEALPHAIDGDQPDAEGLMDLLVGPGVALRAGIGSEQGPGPEQLASGGLARGDQLLQLTTFLWGQGDDILLVHLGGSSRQGNDQVPDENAPRATFQYNLVEALP